MLKVSRARRGVLPVAALALLFAFPGGATADHSWGSYHWARTANPFTLQLGDNVSGDWDTRLGYASTDWSLSGVMDTPIVPGGTNPKRCGATRGRVEVCNASYGRTGWLGVAQIWVSGSHIVAGTAKLNDTYFNKQPYNTPAWRQLVMCQEVGHTFGLDHQDEDFYNPNLGTCMDYTANPAGPPSNEHPNDHDYEQLDLIYAHLDDTTTVSSSSSSGKGNGLAAANDSWGRLVAVSKGGRSAVYELTVNSREKVVTFVIWAEQK